MIFLLLSALVATSISPIVRADQSKTNGLTIALDTVGTSNAQTIIDFMKRWNYNGLRIYMGWCASFWTGNVDAPMNTRTQDFIDELCRLCAQNNFTVVCAVSMQVTPFKTAFPSEIQVGPNGEQNSQGNWVCPTGPNFVTFTKNLIKILIGIMQRYATPRISVDEIVFITGGGRPAFYSQSMRTAYRQATGRDVPVFSSTSGSYSSEQRQFIEFAKGTIRTFYQTMESTARAENANVLFGALIDTYWVYPKTSDDTQPYDYYATVDEVVYEWFYAIQNQNWAGITEGLQRIKNLNPSANHYFIYGTSTMTSITNMRRSVQLTMDADYDGVFLYEYAKSRNNPFDVSDIVLGGPSSPPPPPTQNQYGTLKFSTWNGENWIVGATLTITFPNGTTMDMLTPYDNSQAPAGSYTVKCVSSGQEADNSPHTFTLYATEIESFTFVFGTTPPPSSAYFFEDNFDSADFNSWTGVRTSYGEIAQVVEMSENQVGYHAQFSSNGRSQVEYAYCYKTVDMQEVIAAGDFFISWGLPLGSDGDRIYFVRIMSGQDYLVSLGIGRYDGSSKWVLRVRDGADWAPATLSSSPVVEMGRWYRIELHWKKHVALGFAEAYVNNERVLSAKYVNTASFGNATQINFGLMSTLNEPKRVSVYGDYFWFSEKMPWDLNQDSRTDMLDIVIVTAAYGSTIESPKWDARADVNKSGTVDFRDIIIILPHFGEVYA
jgi:hypothetical protein